jgi:N-acyl-phosphatidylethanolamine-hydrolysing phospholipase D
LFEDRQIDAIVLEKDWWDTSKVSGFKMTFVPAQHFSGRIIFDLNKSLWGGWVVERAGRKVYFAGDTGYTKEFKELGSRMGPMDVSLIPIGAYAPRDVLKFLHANPFDAVQIHKDVKSKHSIAAHWGTFRLTTEPMGEPKKLLEQAVEESDLASDSFTTMSIGQTRAY